MIPTIGSKEAVSGLPFQLGLSSTDTVAIPELAYPTYEVGARLAGAQLLRTDSPLTAAGHVSLLWLNSPSNPTGAVLPVETLRKLVSWARANNTIIASDECYIDLGWDTQPISILHSDISGRDHTGLLALHSLSKRSNLAGYRIGFISGDRALVHRLLQVRKHMGLIMPGPVQAAAIAALDDDGHVMAQRSRYQQRREVLTQAFDAADSGSATAVTAAGATRGPVAESALRLGRVAGRTRIWSPPAPSTAPPAPAIWIALTATDKRVAAAVSRLDPEPVRRHPSAGIACGPAAALAALRDRGRTAGSQFDHEKLHAKDGVSRV